MPSPVPPFAVQLDEGVTLKTPTAGHVIVRADTAQTNASLTVLEFLVPPNDGPAVHAHLREDEVWYVIEGDFRFKAAQRDGGLDNKTILEIHMVLRRALDDAVRRGMLLTNPAAVAHAPKRRPLASATSRAWDA